MWKQSLTVFALFVLALPVVAQDADITPAALKTKAEALDEAGIKALADEYKAGIDATSQRIDDLSKEIEGAAADEKEGLTKEAEAAATRIEKLGRRLDVIVKVIQAKGFEIDLAAYQQAIITATNEFKFENLSADVAIGLIGTWIKKGKDWVVNNGPGVIFNIVAFLLILLVFKILASTLGKVTRRALASMRLKVSDLLRNFFVNVVTKITMLVGLLIALKQIGIDIGPLLAGIGVIGFIVGFALQGTLSNFAAGIMILLYRPYDIGHVIDAAGVKGKVESMTLVSTTLLTPDNQEVVVPNNSIWGGVITNVTARRTRRVDLGVGVSYSDDLDKTAKVLLEVVTGHPKVLADPAPVVKLNTLADSSVNFVVRPWSKTEDYWDVYWDLTKAIKQRLDEEGISIPFPQRDIHIVSNVGNGPSK